MASNQTTNYGLNQWEAEDKVIRTEFNEDNAKIDAALGTIPKIVTGTYTGNGAASRFIDLGFTPKAVCVFTEDGMTYSSAGSGFFGGLALTDRPVIADTEMVLKLEGTGFLIYFQQTTYYNIYSNASGSTYHYIAIG